MSVHFESFSLERRRANTRREAQHIKRFFVEIKKVIDKHVMGSGLCTMYF
jgi:hypothetical protein